MAVALSPSDRSSVPSEGRPGTWTSNTGNLLGALLKDRVGTGCSHRSFREKYLDEALDKCKSMYSCDIRGHHGCVNALAFSKGQEQFLASGGDDQRVLVWRVADMVSKPKSPRSTCMNNRHTSNIFTLDFSCDNAYIFSGGEDKELLMHDFKTGYTVNTYEHLDAVYCATSNPTTPEVVYTASEDGCVYIIDTRVARRQLGQDMLLCESQYSFQCVAVNPVEPVLIAVSNSHSGSSLYDIRMKKRVVDYECSRISVHRHDGVSVAFDSTGTRVYSMYRQRPPTLHNLYDPDPVCYFSDSTGHYKNAITMKSGCFMGQNDEYIVSGSDDFRVYIWKVPSSEELQAARQTLNKEDVCAILFTCSPKKGSFDQSSPHLVLPGHRSIVNQARYSPVNRILVTSGVEKIVKVWSDLPIHSGHTLHQSGGPPARERFTRSELRSILLGISYSEPSDPTEEDVKVLALFDNLVDENGDLSDSSDDSLFAPGADEDFFFPFWRNRHDHFLFMSSDSDSNHSLSFSDDWDSFSDSSSSDAIREFDSADGDHGSRGEQGVMAERSDEEAQVDSLEEEEDDEEEESMEEEDTFDETTTEEEYDGDPMNTFDLFARGFARYMAGYDESDSQDSRDSGDLEDGPGTCICGHCGDGFNPLPNVPPGGRAGGGAEESELGSKEKVESKLLANMHAGASGKNGVDSSNEVPNLPFSRPSVRKGAKAQVKMSEGHKASTSVQKEAKAQVKKGEGHKASTSIQKGAKAQVKKGEGHKASTSVQKGAKVQVKMSEGSKASTNVHKGNVSSPSSSKKLEAKNSKAKPTSGALSKSKRGGGREGPDGTDESLVLETEQDSGMRLRTREVVRTTRSKCTQKKTSSRTELASTVGSSDGACALDRPPGPSPSDPCGTELLGTSGEGEGSVGATAMSLDGEDDNDANNGSYRTRSKRKKIMDFRARCDSGALQERYAAEDFLRTKSPTNFYGSSERSKGKESGKDGTKKKGGRKKGGGGDPGNSNR